MNEPKDYHGDLQFDPSGFKTKARRHQSDYRQNSLKVDFADPYGSRINEVDGFGRGLNFYEGFGVRDYVNVRYKNFKEPLHSNLLRSEHIPFNFFIPIDKFKEEKDTVGFLNDLIPGLNAAGILEVKIEFAPPKAKALSDNTSFDTYIKTVDSDNKITGIGVEVKYTEKSYRFGKSEKEKMFDPEEKSSYHLTSEFAGINKQHTSLLREQGLKQFWRNYLLGVTMVREGLINRFVSVQLYPSGNQYQEEKSQIFESLLPDDERLRFQSLRFEQFIETGKRVWSSDADKMHWLKYLEERYIVRE